MLPGTVQLVMVDSAAGDVQAAASGKSRIGFHRATGKGQRATGEVDTAAGTCRLP